LRPSSSASRGALPLAEIRQRILELFPREAELESIEFEGPLLAVYVRRPEVLLEGEGAERLRELVKEIRKRIVVRTSDAARMCEGETDAEVRRILPPEVGIVSVLFDRATGEVIIEARNPQLVIMRGTEALREIQKVTRWKPRLFRAPALPSYTITAIRHLYGQTPARPCEEGGVEEGRNREKNEIAKKTKKRRKILNTIGQRVFRDRFLEIIDSITVTFLGGALQVGRSAVLISTNESRVLVDCGINPGAAHPSLAYPRFDYAGFSLDDLDAVVITHAHLDHCGFLPVLFKYGYEGPVYCTEPTVPLMYLLLKDYLEVARRRGVYAPFTIQDVEEAILHCIPLRYGTVVDIAPDIKLTLYNAGHIVGSAMAHFHIGTGLHNILYTGDIKYAFTLLLEPAYTRIPRVETLIIESTYGGPEDVLPSREESEQQLAAIISEAVQEGGKVLIPTLAVERAQDIMLVLNKLMDQGKIPEIPVFVEGLLSEVTALHTAYPEYLSRELQEQIYDESRNPFLSERFEIVKGPEKREEIITGGPAVILATSGMLEGGPILDYLRYLASSPRNVLVFVSYQIEGTLGRRILEGERDLTFYRPDGQIERVRVEMRIRQLTGFSAHSDRRQLSNFVRRFLRTLQRVVVVHGEGTKARSFASFIRNAYKVPTIAPQLLETIRAL